jgi:hypothetical protein
MNTNNTTDIPATYVRTTDGTYLVQLPDARSKGGFALFDDDQSWEGGLGVASTWTAVPPEDVPEADRERLGWIFSDCGYSEPARYVGPVISDDATMAALCGSPHYWLELEIDWEHRTIDITARHNSNTSWTMREHHGHASTFELPILVRDDALSLIAALRQVVGRVADTYRSEWDGRNHVARWSHSEDEHDELLHEIHIMIQNARYTPAGGVWDAADYLEADPPRVPATTTDEQLQELEARLQGEAHDCGVHLHDLDEYLEQRRRDDAV